MVRQMTSTTTKVDPVPKKVREWIEAGHSVVNFVRQPRPFASKMKEDKELVKNPTQFLIAVVAMCTAVLIGYTRLAGSFDELMHEILFADLTSEQRAKIDEIAKGREVRPGGFRVAAVGTLLPFTFETAIFGEQVRFGPAYSCGAGIESLEPYMPLNKPQTVALKIGCSTVVLTNFVPEEKAVVFTTVIITAFTLITAICLWLCLRLLGACEPFGEYYRLTALWYGSVLLLATVLGCVQLVMLRLLIDRFGYGFWRIMTVVLIFTVPAAILMVQSFFAGFSEVYGISKKRLFVYLIPAWLLSSLIGPVMLLPILFALRELTPLLEKII
jgi:hypothetical protein